jgi:hypothetical protein
VKKFYAITTRKAFETRDPSGGVLSAGGKSLAFASLALALHHLKEAAECVPAGDPDVGVMTFPVTAINPDSADRADLIVGWDDEGRVLSVPLSREAAERFCEGAP